MLEEQQATVFDNGVQLSTLFSNISFSDVFDVFVVSMLIYIALVFIKQTRSFLIFTTIVVLLGISYLSQTFDLGLTRQVFQPFLTFFLLIIVIVFQRDIRRFFEWFSVSGRSLAIRQQLSLSQEITGAIVEAVTGLARRRTGAIIVLSGSHPLEPHISGGFTADTRVTVPILMRIFDKKNPGHDGAAVIADNRVKYFGVHLPLAGRLPGIQNAGTRHRAALGISEETDSFSIVVSEERGTISVAHERKIHEVKNFDDLAHRIESYQKQQLVHSQDRSIWRYLIMSNWVEKIAAIGLASFLWFTLIFQASVITREFNVPINFQFVPDTVVIQNTGTANAEITLSGRDRDFANLNGGTLSITINAAALAPGIYDIELGEENIDIPSYFNIEQISPDSVSILVERVPDEIFEEPSE